MKKLFFKEIDVKSQSAIIGGSWADSGGTESWASDQGNDTITQTFNDDCGVQSVSVCQNH